MNPTIVVNELIGMVMCREWGRSGDGLDRETVVKHNQSPAHAGACWFQKI